jgi:hypothetical protein
MQCEARGGGPVRLIIRSDNCCCQFKTGCVLRYLPLRSCICHACLCRWRGEPGHGKGAHDGEGGVTKSIIIAAMKTGGARLVSGNEVVMFLASQRDFCFPHQQSLPAAHHVHHVMQRVVVHVVDGDYAHTGATQPVPGSDSVHMAYARVLLRRDRVALQPVIMRSFACLCEHCLSRDGDRGDCAYSDILSEDCDDEKEVRLSDIKALRSLVNKF